MFENKKLPAGLSFRYETPRLILKILMPESVADVRDFLYRNRGIFEPYEPTAPANYYQINFQRAMLQWEFRSVLKRKAVRFFVFRKENPSAIIGTVCLHGIAADALSCCEVGYKFDAAYQRRGYALEALQKILFVAFRVFGLHRVFARALPENEASRKLLLSAGFQEEGIERECILIQGKWRDHIRYVLLAADFSPCENEPTEDDTNSRNG